MVSGRPIRAAAGARWLLGVVLVGLTLAAAAVQGEETPAFPALTGRVVDAAGILDSAAERALGAELEKFERSSGGIQIVVATVASLHGRPIEEFGYQLGRHWGIGARGEDSGALLLVAPAERQVRIEVGYGLEGDLTDAVSWDIIQGRVLPHFRDGNYEAGVQAGARAMMAALAGDYEPAPQAGESRRKLPALAFWIFMVIILLSSFGSRGGGMGRALLLGSLLGGSGRRGFGGGGGGFRGGGGSFGGGGASGGW